MISCIARRELRGLFLSPLAWSLMGITQLILAWVFLVQLEDYLRVQNELLTLEGAPGITGLIALPLFDAAALLLLLISPLLCMRMLSEEFRQGTIELLLSSPVSLTAIVLGKYLAILLVFTMIVLLTLSMPLSLMLGGTLDLGRLAAATLGLWLCAAAFSAIGLFFSSLTRQPAVAAVTSYGLLLLLWINRFESEASGVPNLFGWLSLSEHYRRLTSGLVYSDDLLFYPLITLLFLLLTIKRLDTLRGQG